MEENMIAKKNKPEGEAGAARESAGAEPNAVANDNSSATTNAGSDTTTGTSSDAQADTSAEAPSGEMPELPEGEAGMGPMGGGFPGETASGTVASGNEWLVPMSCAGVISGAIILAVVAVCGMIWKIGKKVSK